MPDSAPDRRISDRFWTSSLREAAGDPSVGGDARFDARRRLHPAVEDDRELAADVLARSPSPNSRRAVVVQREADRRLIVLVDRRPRVAQILAA